MQKESELEVSVTHAPVDDVAAGVIKQAQRDLWSQGGRERTHSGFSKWGLIEWGALSPLRPVLQPLEDLRIPGGKLLLCAVLCVHVVLCCSHCDHYCVVFEVYRDHANDTAATGANTGAGGRRKGRRPERMARLPALAIRLGS